MYPPRLAVQINGWQELRACFTSCGPSLLDSGECCRKIEILSTRALHYAREHRVVEAIPPGFERGRWSAHGARLQRGGAVELLKRCCRLLIGWADSAT
jgi:hypothetical protein